MKSATNAIPRTQVNIPPQRIDFGLGQPDPALLPLPQLQQAAQHRFALGDTDMLGYGFEQGDGTFLAALAAFLTQNYGFAITPNQLFLTSGASQALDLICTLFTQPGDVVFVEEPTYFLALGILANYDLQVVGIPLDEHGLRVDALEAALQQHQPKFLYTIPTFQNPTGALLPLPRRQQIVALSQAHDFLIVADEVYQMLDYFETPPRPFAALIDTGTVLSIGSFSKICAPGLRLGWVQAAPPLVQRLMNSGVAQSGGALNHFTSNIIGSFLTLGLQQEYLAALKQAYAARMAAMGAALAQHFPGAYLPAGGGFFYWVKLPDDVDTAVVLPRAHQHNVGYQPGARFSSQGGLHNYLRLSFAYYDVAAIEVGMKRLAAVFNE